MACCANFVNQAPPNSQCWPTCASTASPTQADDRSRRREQAQRRWEFLTHLRDEGRRAADAFLASNGADIGVRSSFDLEPLLKGL